MINRIIKIFKKQFEKSKYLKLPYKQYNSIPEYINKTVFCTIRPSKIHGVGVFAIRDIKKGTILTDIRINNLLDEQKILKVSEEEFNLIIPEIQELILERMFWVDKEDFIFLSPNCETSIQSLMNHSDNANSDGNIALIDINKGDEITENYKNFDCFINAHKKTKEKYFFIYG